MNVNDKIESLIKENDCVLFMKGTSLHPQCGFSHHAIQLLLKHGVVFKDVNILEDEALRAGLKTYSEWPTFPQLYFEEEFIGGVDIMREMDEAGELAQLFSVLVK
jgi:monothiol glutaredoxin